MVFDCNARFGGVSLKDKLPKGPHLANRLVGVVTRFRQEAVTFIGEIDAMFHQVRVPVGQRDFLRFLWWPDRELSQDLEKYQMNVHLFGAVSSPICPNLALRKAPDDAENIVGTEAADVLRKTFTLTTFCAPKKRRMPLSKGYVMFAMLPPMEGLIQVRQQQQHRSSKYPGRSTRPRS